MKRFSIAVFAFFVVAAAPALAQRPVERTAKPEAQVAIAGTMKELEPMLAKMLPKNMLYWAWPEYGAHAVAERLHLERIDTFAERMALSGDVGERRD